MICFIYLVEIHSLDFAYMKQILIYRIFLSTEKFWYIKFFYLLKIAAICHCIYSSCYTSAIIQCLKTHGYMVFKVVVKLPPNKVAYNPSMYYVLLLLSIENI